MALKDLNFSLSFVSFLLHHCHSDQAWLVVLHVSDVTAVLLLEDYLWLLPRASNVEGINLYRIKSPQICVQCCCTLQPAGKQHTKDHRKGETSQHSGPLGKPGSSHTPWYLFGAGFIRQSQLCYFVTCFHVK